MKPNIHLTSFLALEEPSGFAFVDALRHVFYKLKRLDVNVTMAMNALDEGADANLVFGTYGGMDLMKRTRSTVFNLEQLGPKGFDRDGKYSEFLRSVAVVDYTPDNVPFYRDKGEDVFILPFFYGGHLGRSTLPLEDRPIDVLFFGTLNDRRLDAIDEVRSAGVKVSIPSRPTYGPERDELIRKSKVIFNWGYYETNRFEQVRASLSLSLGTPFISERRSSPEAYERAVFWVDDLEGFFGEKFKTPEFYREATEKLEYFSKIDDLGTYEKLVEFMLSRYQGDDR